MLLGSGVDYYILPLDDLDIQCKSGLCIRSPTLKYRLLSYPDINKVEILLRSGKDIDVVYEEVCIDKIETIMGYPDEVVDFDNSPAGLVPHLGRKIIDNSRLVLEDLEKSFLQLSESLTILDRLSIVVSNHTNEAYTQVKQLPIDELLKRYALCCISFGYPPIQSKEEVNKVA